MKKQILFITLIVLLSSLASSAQSERQKEETIFSNSSVRLTGLWGGNTACVNENQGEYGLYHGGYFLFEFNKSYTLGWQSYGYNEGDLKMKFNGLQLGYTHNPYKVVHPSFNVFVGTGKIKNRDEADLIEIDDNVLMFLPTAGLEVNILRWFRIGLEGGYQFIFDSDVPNVSDSDVSQPFIGMRFKFGYSWGH